MDESGSRDFAGWIGAARRDITPAAGIYTGNWGAAEHETAQGVHRPLTATVLVLMEAAESEPLVLAAVDLSWWKSPADEALIRRPLLDAIGLDEARLMVCLSHTHAGPSICVDDAKRPGGHLIEPYLEAVAAQLVDATRQALREAEPGRLHWRLGTCDLARNRDRPDPTRPNQMLVGYHPEGQADQALLVGRATRDVDGAVLATLVNYACHPTTLAWDNQLISPDYVGAMRELIENATGGAPCLFLQGASGELAPAEQYTGDVEVADRNGRRLGHAAVAQLEAMGPAGTMLMYEGARESGASLGVWRRRPAAGVSTLAAVRSEVVLPLKTLPSEAELEAELTACTDRALAERLRRKLRIVRSLGNQRTCRMPLWAWRVGDAVLLGQPNEAYSAFQQTLRQRLAPHPVAVMNLVNGSCGYLAPAEQCVPGLYAFWQSPFATGGLEALTEHAAAQAESLVGT